MRQKSKRMRIGGGTNRLLLRIICAFLLCAAFVCGALFALPNKKSTVAQAAEVTVDEITINGYENFTSTKIFNGENLTKLYQAILNNKDATFADVANAVAGETNWTQVSGMSGTNNLANNPSAYKVSNFLTSRQLNGDAPLYVKFGGLTWAVTYVTRDLDGKVIATLMLKNSNELSLKTGQWNEGTYYNSNYSGSVKKYPNNMYSSTYARMALLNAGNPDGSDTHYSSFKTEAGYDSLNGTVTAAMRASNQFAKFTLTNATGSLIDYITQPKKVRYQGIQSWSYLDKIQAGWGTNCNLNNEAYEATTVVDKWSSGNYVTASLSKQYVNDWINDYLWLPSLTEVGCNNKPYSDKSGVWCTQNSVRSESGTYLSRTGGCGGAYYDYLFITTNSFTSGYGTGTANIRPCLHLNLTDAEADAVYPIPTDDITTEYNGQKQELSSLVTWADSSALSVTEKSGNFTDVGTHVVTVDLLDPDYAFKNESNTVRSKDINVIITKKKVQMEQPTIDENGDLLDGAAIEMSDIKLPYANDKNDDGTWKASAPDFALEYRKSGSSSWTTTKPTVAGSYFARPYISNPSTCNYEIDYTKNCEAPFTKPKASVGLPYFTNSSLSAGDISGTVTTVQYSGDWQDFDLVNDAANNALVGVSIGARTGGLAYSASTGKFRARNVGDYTVTVSLLDGGANTRWADYTNTAPTRIITLKIVKRELNVTFDNDSVTSWSNGDRTDIKITATGVVNNENPKLHVYYTKTKDGTTSAPVDVPDSAMTVNGADINVTVDLTGFEANTKYALYVELAPDIAANKNYTIKNNAAQFDFFILEATIASLDVEWQYENPKTGTNTVTAAETLVEYNEQEYTFELNLDKLPAGVEVTYSGTYQATNVEPNGLSYTATATVSAKPGYVLAPDVVTVYTATFKITPLTYDLSKLVWADDPEYQKGMPVYMYLLDSPTGTIKQFVGSSTSGSGETMPPAYGGYSASGWLSVDFIDGGLGDFEAVNMATVVGTYTAGYLLTCDTNHAFEDWFGDPAADDGDGITKNSETSAYITHVWEVTPVQIRTSTKSADWATSTELYDEQGDQYFVPVPNVMAQYPNILEVTYYSNSECKEEDKIEDITKDIDVTPGKITKYYIKLKVKDGMAANYQLYNTVSGLNVNELVKTFTVGDNRQGVPVDFGPDAYVYNGQPQGQAPTIAMQADISYEIFRVSTVAGEPDVSLGTDFPTEAGSYYIDVKFAGDNAAQYELAYRLDPARHYFVINKLPLLTDGWTTGKGIAPPKEKVIADSDYMGGTDYSPLYDYEIFEVFEDGTRDTNPADKSALKYETKYVAVLKIKDTELNNAEFDPTAQTEFEFTTGMDPSNVVIEIPVPVYSATTLPYTGNEQSFTITNWDDIKDHVTMEIDGVEIQNSADYKALEVGSYHLTIKLRTDENVSWAGVGDIPLDFTFEITVREMELPKLDPQTFNGSKFDPFNYLPAGYADWVAVEIVGFTPKNAGTAAEEENGALIVLRAGEYAVKFSLLDPVNTRWASAPTRDGDPATDDIELPWEIKKAVIAGTWDEEGKFIPENPEYEGKYTIKYIDANGNEAAFGEFEDGIEYRAVGVLDGAYANDFEFAEDIRKDGNPNEIETSFTRTASFADKALGLLKQYWIWLVVAFCVLAFLVLGIVAAAKKPKRANVKAYEEELSEEVAEIAEEEKDEEPAEEPAPEPVAARESAQSAAADGMSLLKEELAAMREAISGAKNDANGSAAGSASNANNANNAGGAPAPYANAPYSYPPAYPQYPSEAGIAAQGMGMQQPAGVGLASMGGLGSPLDAPLGSAMGSPMSSPLDSPLGAASMNDGAGSLGIGGLPYGMDSDLSAQGNSLGALPLGMDGSLNDGSLGEMGAGARTDSADALGAMGALGAASALGNELKEFGNDDFARDSKRSRRRQAELEDYGDDDFARESKRPRRRNTASDEDADIQETPAKKTVRRRNALPEELEEERPVRNSARSRAPYEEAQPQQSFGEDYNQSQYNQPQYSEPQYNAPQSDYNASQPDYGQQQNYGGDYNQPQYNAPQPDYGQQQNYGGDYNQPQYNAPQPDYGQQQNYGGDYNQPQYNAPQPDYGQQQNYGGDYNQPQYNAQQPDYGQQQNYGGDYNQPQYNAPQPDYGQQPNYGGDYNQPQYNAPQPDYNGDYGSGYGNDYGQPQQPQIIVIDDHGAHTQAPMQQYEPQQPAQQQQPQIIIIDDDGAHFQ